MGALKKLESSFTEYFKEKDNKSKKKKKAIPDNWSEASTGGILVPKDVWNSISSATKSMGSVQVGYGKLSSSDNYTHSIEYIPSGLLNATAASTSAASHVHSEFLKAYGKFSGTFAEPESGMSKKKKDTAINERLDQRDSLGADAPDEIIDGAWWQIKRYGDSFTISASFAPFEQPVTLAELSDLLNVLKSATKARQTEKSSSLVEPFILTEDSNLHE